MKNIQVNIKREERAILNYAVKHHKGEIIEPANEDDYTMSIIVSIFEKGLAKFDYEQNKLFVSDIGRGLLCL